MKSGSLQIFGVGLTGWKDLYKTPRVLNNKLQFPLVRANRIPKPYDWHKGYRQAGFSKTTLKAFAMDADDPYRLRNTIEYLAIYDKYLTDEDVAGWFDEWGVYADQKEDRR